MNSFELMGSIQMLAHQGQREIVAAAVRSLGRTLRRLFATPQVRNDQLP